MYLIDTNIMSELLRPRPNPGVLLWSERQAMFYFSVISVEETLYGLSRKENSRLLDAYKAFVQQYCEILPISFFIAEDAGRLRGALSKRGIVRSQPDMLIAATARVHGLALVTRNVRDFEGCDIRLINPFEG